MPSRKQLIATRRKELLAKGYRPGIVNLALDWAVGSAEGMAAYVKKHGADGDLTDQFLPQYLNDCEKWARSIHGEPTQPET